MKFALICLVFWILTTHVCTRNTTALKCPAGQGTVNEECRECPAGFFGNWCNVTCIEKTFGVRCSRKCNCKSSEQCHHIHGCITMTTSGKEITGSTKSPTHQATNSNKWIFIILAFLLATTFMLCLLRTRLVRCIECVHKAHDEAVQLRETNNRVRHISVELKPPQHLAIEFQENAYSEIRESQMVGQVFFLGQINTLMHGPMLVSTRNKSRYSDIYDHLDNSFSINNVDTVFDNEYAHAHSVGVTRGTVVNPMSELVDKQSTDEKNKQTECDC